MFKEEKEAEIKEQKQLEFESNPERNESLSTHGLTELSESINTDYVILDT